jgi:hypothetical protein
MTAGPECGATLHAKNLIIDKSMYGLKTSAARFHGHLSESLLRKGYSDRLSENSLSYGFRYQI